MTPTNLRDLLKRDEGCVLHAYRDSLGYLTIGVGRLVDERKGGGISQAEADMLLDNDIGSCRAAIEDCLPWAVKLDEVRFAVLVSMAFQMGIAGLLQFKQTLGHVELGEYDAAAQGMLSSRWAKQTPERAGRLAEMMKTGEWK